jgi:hypothetical protein
MKQVIILNLLCVSVFLQGLKLEAKGARQVSGLPVKLRCLLKHTKQQGEDTSLESKCTKGLSLDETKR